MRITKVDIHRIRIPLTVPTLWMGGVNRSWSRAIVRMHTDEGLEGIAETVGDDSTVRQICELTPVFIGEDPFDHEVVLRKFWDIPATRGTSGKCAVQVLESACWDVIGKAVQRPLCQLLGGAVRSKVAAIAYVGYPARGAAGMGAERRAREVTQYAEELVATHGFRTIKMKGGVLRPEEELATVRALREAFPLHALRFDPNASWSVETAIRIGHSFEELGLEWYEDPVWGVERMSRARRDVRIPFATNMCCVQLDQLPVAIRARAVDIQLLDVHEWGGVAATLKAAAVCETFGIGVGLHSGGEAGISTALNLHLAAAFPTFPYAMDSFYHQQMADVIAEPHRYVDGALNVPKGPGLGVEIDEAKLRHLESLYERGDTYESVSDPAEGLRFPGRW